MSRVLGVLAVCCALSACEGGQAPPPEHPSPPPEHPSPPATSSESTEGEGSEWDQARRCLPVLSGCGCAERCGDGFQQRDGSWGVVRPGGDSALDEVTLERRCFDARGVSYHEDRAPDEASLCIDVFVASMACGGECIPRTEFLQCASLDGRCAATSAQGAAAPAPLTPPTPAGDHPGDVSAEAHYLSLLSSLSYDLDFEAVRAAVRGLGALREDAGERNEEARLTARLFGVEMNGEFNFHDGVLVSHGFTTRGLGRRTALRVYRAARDHLTRRHGPGAETRGPLEGGHEGYGWHTHWTRGGVTFAVSARRIYDGHTVEWGAQRATRAAGR